MNQKCNLKRFYKKGGSELAHVQTLETEIRAIDMYIHDNVDSMSVHDYSNCVHRMRDLCSLMLHLIDTRDSNFMQMESILDDCYILYDNRSTLDF